MTAKLIMRGATIGMPTDPSIPDPECKTCEIPPCWGLKGDMCRIYRMMRVTGARYCSISHRCPMSNIIWIGCDFGKEIDA